MAKGNLGNLLQHFVAIHAADALVRNSPEGAKLVYVDCFSMAPWEEIEKRNRVFVNSVNRFDTMARNGDIVAENLCGCVGAPLQFDSTSTAGTRATVPKYGGSAENTLSPG